MAQQSEEYGGEQIETRHHVVVSPSAIVIPLTAEHINEARACLRRSGRITFSFKEISVTKLPETLLQNGVLID